MYDKIKELCKEKNTSVNALEQKLGFAKGSLCKIDKNKPSSEKLQKIANFFNVQLDYLTGESEFKTKEEMLQHFDKNFNSTKVAEEITTLELVEKNFGKDAVKVLQMFCEMNETGQQKVLEDMSDLIQLPKYVQKDSTMLKNA